MNRHEFDPFSLVFGALFAALGLAFLVGSPDVSRWHGAWVWPVPLIGVGLILIWVAMSRARAGRLIPRADGSDGSGGEPLPRPPVPPQEDEARPVGRADTESGAMPGAEPEAAVDQGERG